MVLGPGGGFGGLAGFLGGWLVETLVLVGSDFATVADLAKIGVRRISVGGALARAAWGGFLRAAKLIADEGRFDGFADAASGAELNKFFREDARRRDGR